MEQVPAKKVNRAKQLAGVLLVIALITGSVLLFTTDTGAKIRSNPSLIYKSVRPFISRHPIGSACAFIAIYVVLAIGALPIWPLQLIGGMGFGLYWGVFISLIGSTIGSVLTVAISRWIAADWFHDRIEKRMESLKKLDETMGHNGFLVVMTVRLVHMLPFGLCNYALGLTRVSLVDVTFGTFLGGIPAATVYVSMGVDLRLLRNWKFDAIVGAINVILLIPLIMRYLRPQWFEKVGIE
jgi:uncharacterized membrane protein YdjX (TVP38/TMEM64 family)